MQSAIWPLDRWRLRIQSRLAVRRIAKSMEDLEVLHLGRAGPRHYQGAAAEGLKSDALRRV